MFRAAVARIAAVNRPIQRIARAFNGRPLGLVATKLTLSYITSFPETSFPEIKVRRLGRSKAMAAWRRWKLHAVEQVAGTAGVRVAADLLDTFGWLDPFPLGKHLALYHNDQEVGFATVRQCAGGLDLDLLPAYQFWPGSQTGTLVAALAFKLKSPVRHLGVSRQHADTLASSAPFEFERDQEQERHFAFFEYPFSFVKETGRATGK
jgi:hypothetical protein